ncbi:DUF4376 domain-containing protein [Priestia endophytica]|uniref:DUF4376 domain-containing protein n=1 Tax=Priestia endophytica TaxID=135735 RepID=UPI00203D20E6|nr:DUF4376 domain-containing protein [Priestia endophytica]MCM3536605.1 DUF4376 domain-containing protein [Priestia endophytica]
MAYLEYWHVDDEGNIIERYVLNNETQEIPPNYFPTNPDKSYYRPKWDFEKGEWYESDLEGALRVEKDALQGVYLSHKEEILHKGFEYNDYRISYDTNGQQQFMMALMNLTLRPLTTTVTIMTKDNQYVTFTKEQFFEMYDLGEQLKLYVQEKYDELYQRIEAIETLEEILSMPRHLQDAINLIENKDREATNG